MKRNGRSITHCTARYVYAAFVKSFDIDDQTIVSYKDHNGRNLNYRNLFHTTRSESRKQSFKRHKDKSYWKARRTAVHQFTIKGKLVAEFESIQEATNKTGFQFSGIAACVNKHIYQHKGFIWVSVKKKAIKDFRRNSRSIFNEYLCEKLGKPRTSKEFPIAALNLSEEDLKGEIWKPIETLEDAYMVSNLGRIKGLARFKHGNLNVWTKEKIKKLIPDGKLLKKKATSCLLVQLTDNGRKFQQSVARLVYHHFVKRIDLFDKSIHIGYKNGLCYDLRWKNLFIQ